MPRLRHSSCAAPGISRQRRGRFEYLDSEGRRIEVLELSRPRVRRRVEMAILDLLDLC